MSVCHCLQVTPIFHCSDVAPDVDNVKDMSRFLSEGIVMKDFHHPNVMGLTGVCFPEEDPPIIILPYMANGDLHTFLKKRRGSVASMDKVEDHMVYMCIMYRV